MSARTYKFLRRMGPGYYISDCGRFYVVGTERAQTRDPKKARKGRLWWNAGRIVNATLEADDATYVTFREAAERCEQLIAKAQGMSV